MSEKGVLDRSSLKTISKEVLIFQFYGGKSEGYYGYLATYPYIWN